MFMQHNPSLRQTLEFRKLQMLFRISHKHLKNFTSQCRIFSNEISSISFISSAWVTTLP